MVHEIKFLLPAEKAPEIMRWAREHLDADPHGEGVHRDEYLVQSIYFDTLQWHVFRKQGSYSRAKYRIRRYNRCDWLFLERKLKRGGIVRKRRTTIGFAELPMLNELETARWFDDRLAVRELTPACFIEYQRMARQKLTSDGMLRLTVDRAFRFKTDVTLDWREENAAPFLENQMILELKYKRLPALAKQLIQEFNLNPAAASKFRTALRASRFAPALSEFETNAESPDSIPGSNGNRDFTQRVTLAA